MRLEQTPRPDQTVRVTARLITSSTILHLSSDEFEHTVLQEQMDNPALDVVEQRVCLFCGTALYGQTCTVCGIYAQSTQPLAQISEASPRYEYTEPQFPYQQQTFYDIDNYGFTQVDSEEEYDPMALISTGETLVETLLLQLEALVTPDDASIAEQLVGNLNERGYLEISLEEVANHLQVSVERVEYVLGQLHTLEPLGIGARNLRECLLIQLRALDEFDPPHPLAFLLIDRHLDQLGRNQFHELARQLKVPEREIHQAISYIRATLHPYPAHTYHTDSRYSRPGSGATYIRPDVIIRRSENGFEVELIEEKRYGFQVQAQYLDHTGQPPTESVINEVKRYMHHHVDHAKFFVECVHRRWRTLKLVATLVVDYQRQFLEKGVRYLRPLTRAEVATRLNLDEGTVSRATANKYALLPNGRLIPFADFFDGSLAIKDILRDLIQSEDARHHLSDDELAHLLTERGILMARRTVTKYREEMGIGSSRER